MRKIHNFSILLKFFFRIVINAIHLKNYIQAEATLEKIVEIYQNREDWATAYKYYNNLVLHLLKTDVKKVTLLNIVNGDRSYFYLNFRRLN